MYFVKTECTKVRKRKDNNINFKERFEQEAEIFLLDDCISNEIKLVRKCWGISSDGFNFKKEFDEFVKWLSRQKENEYKNITECVGDLKLLKFKPEIFLDKACHSYERTSDEYPTGLYFLENENVFHELINEKPYPGIVHTILFNEIFIPESNKLQFTFEGGKYPVLRFGPGATTDDFREFLPLIKPFQDKINNYEEDKQRRKKNLKRDIEIYKIYKSINADIKLQGLKGKQAVQEREGQLYQLMDDMFFTEVNNQTFDLKADFENDKTYLARIRKIVSRMEKRISDNRARLMSQ